MPIDVTNWAADWAAWAYLLIAALVLVDAVLPVVPGETVLLAGGVLAAEGELALAAVIGSAAVGALAGDVLTYRAGRLVGPRLLGRLMRRRRGRRAVIWAATMVDRHGIPLLLFARFVPGGRTAGALTAGFVRFPQRRFAVAATLGAGLWATVTGMLGFLGGRPGGRPAGWVRARGRRRASRRGGRASGSARRHAQVLGRGGRTVLVRQHFVVAVARRWPCCQRSAHRVALDA